MLYLTGIAVLNGCDAQPATHSTAQPVPKNPFIAFIGSWRGDPHFEALFGGARRYAEEIGTVRLQPFVPSDGSPSSTKAAIREALQGRPHALCLCIGDQPESGEYVTLAASEGAAVVTIGDPTPSEAAYARVIIDWADAAELLGRQLPRVAAGRRSYVLLHEDGRSATATQTYQRFRQAAAEHADLAMLTERNASTGDVRPADLVRDMLEQFRNAALVVALTPSTWYADAPGTALGPSNRLVALGAAPHLWDALREGRVAALVGPIDGDAGYAAMELAMRALVERKRLGVVRVIPSEIVTRDNLDDFSRRYRAAAGVERSPTD